MSPAALYDECLRQLQAGLAALPDKPEETVGATLAALWQSASGRAVSAAAAESCALQQALDAAGEARLRELVAQRVQGIPLAYLVGRQRFMGVELTVGPGALIPRRETELLGNAALDILSRIADGRGSASIIDVCTGSGNLAVALALREPRARVWGADLSDAAVDLARLNAERQAVQSRVEFRCGDLLSPFDLPEFLGAIDVVVCNPPYISSGKVDAMPAEIVRHEPRLAFDGGPLGVRILSRLIHDAPRFLRAGGWLAMEVGLGQGRGIRKRLEQACAFGVVREFQDQAGNVRALAAQVATAHFGDLT